MNIFFCLSISFLIFVIRLYSDLNTLFDDSSINDSENVEGNEGKMRDDRLKGKCLSENFILSRQRLTENETFLLSEK